MNARAGEAITFSRHKLATFFACQRRFQLRYLEQYPWPPAPQEEAWRDAGRRGEQFHRLLQRHFLGLGVEDPGEGDEQVRRWWQIFRRQGPVFPAGERLAEVTLTVPAGEHLLTGRFDLLLLGEEGVHLYDWKTTRPRGEAELRDDWQTRLYLALVAEGGSALYPGEKRITPEQVALTYWFVQAPDESVTLRYDERTHAENWAEITRLVEQIDSARAREGEWRLTDDLQTCARCLYQVLCGRQEAVAALRAETPPAPPAEEEGERPGRSRLEPELP